MGKAPSLAPSSAPPSTYRDDPDALSLHTTASDYQYDDIPALPSYSDSVANDGAPSTSSQSTAHPANQQIEPPHDPYRAFLNPGLRRGQKHQTPSAALGQETSVRMDPSLMNADALEEYITQYLRMVPPKQVCRVQGWHWQSRRKENGKTEKDRIFDFDIVFDMSSYLPQTCKPPHWQADVIKNNDLAHRGSFRQTRARGAKQDVEVGIHEHRPDLKDWCRDFCNDKAWLKIFRVSRVVYGMDFDLLRERIMAIVRSTHYRGHVDITFPLSDKYVEIYSPHWINSMRISWVRWIFYLTFLWLITWPVLYLATRQWTVYKVSWYFSIWQHNPARVENPSWKTYNSVTEEEWVERHSNLIQSLVVELFQGDATDMPTDVDPRTRDRSQGAMPIQTGNSNVDAAVTFVQGGVSVWNAFNGRNGAGQGGGWGGDTC